jgi:hypothetical protein
MLEKISKNDSFVSWREKINAIIDQQTEIISFNIDTDASVGLNLSILGGRVREKSEVNVIEDTIITLTHSTTHYVGISLDIQYNPVIVAGPIADKPQSDYIHLYEVDTNADQIINVIDLRTIFNAADISTTTIDTASAIVQFEKSIFANFTITDTKNALSVSPTIEDGITVTVSDNAIWSIV